MNKTMGILSCFFLLFIAKYFPPDHALFVVLGILLFYTILKTMEAITKWNYKIGSLFFGTSWIMGSITSFTINDYIMFYVFNFFMFFLIIELLWLQPKEIIVKIVSENKPDSV